jgi:hypothetical protein
MDVQDGFIVGIDNYCDRWCETCRFTSRCRSFAQMTEFEARQDPSMATLTSIRFDAAPPIRPEVVSAIAALERRPRVEEPTVRRADEEIPRAHQSLLARVEGYAFHAAQSLPAVDASSTLRDAATIVARYCFFISGKVCRALINVAGPCGGDSLDANGSAKAALVALERSHGAWLALSAAKLVPRATAEALLSDVVWLRLEIERVFPHARSFVRPGFDEPDAVAELRAQDAS